MYSVVYLLGRFTTKNIQSDVHIIPILGCDARSSAKMQLRRDPHHIKTAAVRSGADGVQNKVLANLAWSRDFRYPGKPPFSTSRRD